MEVGSFSYTLAFPRLDFGFVSMSDSSLASFFGGGGSSWVDVYAWLRHGQPGRASSFLRPSLRSAGGGGLHS